MRNLRFYLISLAIHAVALGLLVLRDYLGGIHGRRSFPSARRTAVPGSPDSMTATAVVLEGEFVPCSQATEVHIIPTLRNASRRDAERIDRGPDHRVRSDYSHPSVETPSGRPTRASRRFRSHPLPRPLCRLRRWPREPWNRSKRRRQARRSRILTMRLSTWASCCKGSSGTQAALSSGDGPSDAPMADFQTGGRSGRRRCRTDCRRD